MKRICVGGENWTLRSTWRLPASVGFRSLLWASTRPFSQIPFPYKNSQGPALYQIPQSLNMGPHVIWPTWPRDLGRFPHFLPAVCGAEMRWIRIDQVRDPSCGRARPMHGQVWCGCTSVRSWGLCARLTWPARCALHNVGGVLTSDAVLSSFYFIFSHFPS